MGSSGDGGVVVALCLVAVVVMATIGGEATLTTDFYDDSCPEIYSIVEAEVAKAVATEARNAAPSPLPRLLRECKSLTFRNASTPGHAISSTSKLNLSFVTVLDNRFIFAYQSKFTTGSDR
jgi:hypothetical protein